MNGLWTGCGIGVWALCEWAAQTGALPSWLAILLIAPAAYAVGRFGSRLIGKRADVR